MKFSCLQENLNKGLSLVNKFTSSKSTLPILGNILFKATKDGLFLNATNLESGINLFVNAKVDEVGQITVSAKTIVELISQLPPEKIDFQLVENNLKIESPKLQTSINGLSAEEFPALPVFKKEKQQFFQKKDLVLPLEMTVFSAGIDESRPVLSGVKIFKEGKTLVFVTTDGYRLSLKKIEWENKTGNDFETILPARTLLEIIRVLKDQEDESLDFEFLEKENQALFGFSKGEMFCRVLDGQFPDFKKIIPSGFTGKIILNRDELLKAVKTVSIFARESSNILNLKTEGNGLIISARSSQVGEGEAEVDIKAEGEPINIAFNCRFLLELLNTVSCEEIVLETNGSTAPGVFKIAGDDSFLHLIMPIRTQEGN